jgi:hypothetical protein
MSPHTRIYLSSYRDFSEMVLEFGALRHDKGIHRLVAVANTLRGVTTLSYEVFS